MVSNTSEAFDKLDDKKKQIRLAAEADLETFIRLVAPYQVIGGIHQELISWWTRSEASRHQLLLLPRDHGKSRYVAFRVVWELTRHPWKRVLYISSTSNLAEKQLKFMRDIFESKIYRRYWPEMVNEKESEREKWTSTEISLDHPSRKAEGIRDPSIFIAGLTTGITGMHCDIAVLDDVVVGDNAETVEGRNKVYTQYSFLASIEGADSEEWVVGTRYHPSDLYNEMLGMKTEIYNPAGEIIDTQPIYEVFQRQVEDVGDGTGEFLWPRQQRSDGKWFGFDARILAEKRAKYIDKTQFRAQYYNDPNDISNAPISRDLFQYYDHRHIKRDGLSWYYKGSKLNIVAAVDFAYSLSKRSDYTTITVLGIDGDRNKYILDLDRFKTTEIKEYYFRILQMHEKWEFNKLIAETTAAQEAIVKELKESYIKPNGIRLSVTPHKPTKHQGSKEERLKAILEPAYQNRSVWHYRGGYCQILEDELVLEKPPHDDLKDALATAIEHSVPPARSTSNGLGQRTKKRKIKFHPKFGGVAGMV